MRVIICDDNPHDIHTYSIIVKKVLEQADIDAELLLYESPKKLLFDMEDSLFEAQVLILDISMPEIDGMEVAKKLRISGYKREIVFITFSKSHMLGAFDVRAFNYIVKGETSESRIETILKNVFEAALDKEKEYILFTGVGEYRNIAISSIKYFEVNGKIITVHYGHKEFEFISTIGKLENTLHSKGFIKIHRSYLVAEKSIKSFSYNEAVLYDGMSIPVGRKYYSALKAAMLGTKVS